MRKLFGKHDDTAIIEPPKPVVVEPKVEKIKRKVRAKRKAKPRAKPKAKK